MTADTFDLLNTRVVMKMKAVGVVSATPLVVWNTALWLNDSLSVATQAGVTDASGNQLFADAVAATALSDTFFMRLSNTQAVAGTHEFSQTPVAMRGTAAGPLLRFIHNGTAAVSDPAYVGDETVMFTDADLVVRVYDERDDSLPGGPPKYTTGDNIENADNVQFSLKWRHTGASTDSTRTLTAAAVDGVAMFVNVPIAQDPYTLNARSLVSFQKVLNDTTLTVGTGGSAGDLTGGRLSSKVYPLGDTTTARHAAFAFKYTNGAISGSTLAADATPASGLIVTATPTTETIQGSATLTDTTDAAGLYGWSGLTEGKYTVSVAGDATWGVVTGPVTDTLQNNGDVDIVNFIVGRLDTAVKGVVVHDRDLDSTLDPNDKLVGVTIELYRDGSGAVTLDTLVATTTTDANGAYLFSGLPESRYIIKALQPSGSVVLRGYASPGAIIDTTIATTTATTVGSGNNNTRTVGSTTPAALPSWDYDASLVFFDGLTNLTFLQSNNVAQGKVTTPALVAIANARVEIRRCRTSAGWTSPAAAGVCTTYFAGTLVTVNTSATGAFRFTSLIEGVWEVKPVVASTPASRLFRFLSDNPAGDNENGDFTQP